MEEVSERRAAEIADRWRVTWAAASALTYPDRAQLLVFAIETFIAQELRGVAPTRERVGEIIAGVERARTHSVDSIIQAASRTFRTGGKTFWTRPRRMAAAALALWWLFLAGWHVVHHDYRYTEEIPLLDLAIVVPLIAAAAYAALRWVQRAPA